MPLRTRKLGFARQLATTALRGRRPDDPGGTCKTSFCMGLTGEKQSLSARWRKSIKQLSLFDRFPTPAVARGSSYPDELELPSGRAGPAYAAGAVPPGTRYGPAGRENWAEKTPAKRPVRVPSGTPGPGPLAPKPVTSRGGEVSPHYRAPKIRTARPRSRTRSQSAQQIAKPVTPHSRAVAKKSPPTAQPPIDSPDIRPSPSTNHRPSPSITAHNRSKISSIVPTPSTARNLFCFL